MQLAQLDGTYWLSIWHQHGKQLVGAAAKIVIILVAYFVVRFVLLRLIGKLTTSLVARVSGDLLQTRKARVRALQTILGSTVGFVLGFVAAIMVLQAAGINIVPLLTTASVAGLAIGFGAQKLVRDVIAGLFILIEDQYGVGDYVTIGAVTGVVEELGMRITRIRERTGKLYILANGDINQVCNHSRGKLIAFLDVAVVSTADLDTVRRVLDEAGESVAREMPSYITEAYRCDGLAQITGAASTLRLAGSVVPRYQDDVHMALNARIREAFEKNEIPLA